MFSILYFAHVIYDTRLRVQLNFSLTAVNDDSVGQCTLILTRIFFMIIRILWLLKKCI